MSDQTLLETAKRYAGKGGCVHPYGGGFTADRREGGEPGYFRQFIISHDVARELANGGEWPQVQFVGTFRGECRTCVAPVRMCGLCPVCGEQYGLSELSRRGRVAVHWMCDPINQAEFRRFVASVDYLPRSAFGYGVGA